MLEEGLIESMQQLRHEKCCAINKHHGEMDITMCSASVPYLSDTKQPGTLYLDCRKWHFVLGTCHLEDVLNWLAKEGSS